MIYTSRRVKSNLTAETRQMSPLYSSPTSCITRTSNGQSRHSNWPVFEMTRILSILQYLNISSYMSIYEKDLFLEFKKGILFNKRVVDNTKTFDPDDPMGIKELLLAMAEEYTKNLKKDKPPEF